MKQYIGYIILTIVLIAITVLISYTVITKRNLTKEGFNIKSGEVLKFNDFDTELKVKNVAGVKCLDTKKCKYEAVEVSVTAIYNDEESNYTLNSKTNPNERIKNSNNYIVLLYEDNKIKLEIKDRFDIK